MRIEDDGDNDDDGFSAVSDDDENDEDGNKYKDEYEAEGDALARPHASHTATDLGRLRFDFAQGERHDQRRKLQQ